MSRAETALAVVLLAAVVASLPASAFADQLVLRDGTTVATRGAVKFDSRRAIYTDPLGHLVALRIEEVDVARTTALLAPPAKSSPAATPAQPRVPVKPKAPVLRLTDADVGHVTDAAGAPAADAAEAPVVTLYSTSWCGWCRKSRNLMQSLGIAFVERDVERDSAAAAAKARLAGPAAGVPVLERGGEVVRGFDEATIRSWAPARPASETAPTAEEE
ncbi:MAG: glutaredoxin family protein [Thermoanaerobaculia bacterium]